MNGRRAQSEKIRANEIDRRVASGAAKLWHLRHPLKIEISRSLKVEYEAQYIQDIAIQRAKVLSLN